MKNIKRKLYGSLKEENVLRLNNQDIEDIRKMSQSKTYSQIQDWFREKYPDLGSPSLNTIGYHVNRTDFREKNSSIYLKDFFHKDIKFKEETRVNYFKKLFKLIHKIQKNNNYSKIFTSCFFQPISAEELKADLDVNSISSLNQFQHFMNSQGFDILKRMSYSNDELVEKIDLDKNTPVYYYVDLSTIYKKHPLRKMHKDSVILKLHNNPCFRNWLYCNKLSDIFDLPCRNESEKLESFKNFIQDEDKFFMLLTTFVSREEIYKRIVLPFIKKTNKNIDISNLYEAKTQNTILKNYGELLLYFKRISKKLISKNIDEKQADIICKEFVKLLLELVQIEDVCNSEKEKAENKYTQKKIEKEIKKSKN